MSKQEKKDLVPALRFPEFRNAGGWKKKHLAPYIEQYSERASSNTELEVYSSTREGLKPQSEYYDGRNLVNDGEYGVVPTGYFVYRHMSDDDVFKFNLNQLGKKIAVSKEYPVFKTINLDARFLLNKLNEGKEFKKFAVSQKKGGTRTRLYFNTLRTFESFLPAFEEQQKIADCLTSVDELITAQTQKLIALKAHKKGLMQQLFPAKGETVPKLRFPEFRDARAWEEKRLGDIGSVRMCKRIFKEQTNPSGDIPFYKIGTFGGIPDAFISREIFENYRNNFPFPKNGAVLISAAGTIGRTVLYKGELAYFQDSNIVWLDNNEKLIVDNFLFYLYQLINWTPSVGTIQRLYNENIHGARVKFPSIPEQQKIADCLSSLDDLITTQTQKLDSLKNHKKGLMEQLFPTVDEVDT